MPNLGVSMLALDREAPERRRWTERLGARFMLVQYDARGTGYSQRDAADVSVEAHLRDLEAVVAALDLEELNLFGYLWSAYIAPYYAARQSGMVSRLMLWPPDTRRSSSREYRSLGELAISDWETFTETYAHLAMGWTEGDAAHRFAKVMRESVDPQMFLRQVSETRVSVADLEEVARRVRVPTLVLQRKMRLAADRVARLVAALPDARLKIFEGESTVPYIGDVDAVVDAMATFAGIRGPAMPRDRAILQFPPQAGERTGIQLTLREREILKLVAAGLSNQEIASELVLSVRTVERHLYNVYDKIGVSGKSARAAAAAYFSGRRLA
jgi:DNA-binding CsgD family transcriptional regulator/pimeloyl-ACP methyl ester carboxylesterase